MASSLGLSSKEIHEGLTTVLSTFSGGAQSRAKQIEFQKQLRECQHANLGKPEACAPIETDWRNLIKSIFDYYRREVDTNGDLFVSWGEVANNFKSHKQEIKSKQAAFRKFIDYYHIKNSEGSRHSFTFANLDLDRLIAALDAREDKDQTFLWELNPKDFSYSRPGVILTPQEAVARPEMQNLVRALVKNDSSFWKANADLDFPNMDFAFLSLTNGATRPVFYIPTTKGKGKLQFEKLEIGKTQMEPDSKNPGKSIVKKVTDPASNYPYFKAAFAKYSKDALNKDIVLQEIRKDVCRVGKIFLDTIAIINKSGEKLDPESMEIFRQARKFGGKDGLDAAKVGSVLLARLLTKSDDPDEHPGYYNDASKTYDFARLHPDPASPKEMAEFAELCDLSRKTYNSLFG